MMKNKKYNVYMCHYLGFRVRLVGTYDTREEAERVKSKTWDSQFDSWIVEVDDEDA